MSHQSLLKSKTRFILSVNTSPHIQLGLHTSARKQVALRIQTRLMIRRESVECVTQRDKSPIDANYHFRARARAIKRASALEGDFIYIYSSRPRDPEIRVRSEELEECSAAAVYRVL